MTLANRLLRTFSPGSSHSFKGRLLAFVFGLIFGSGGLAVFWSLSLDPVLKNLEAEHWHQAEGTVISSSLSTDDEGGMTFSILYTYQIQGNEHQCDVYNPTDTSRNFATESLKKAIADYPAGKTVTVWVNPEDYEDAVLDRSIQPIAWMGFIFSIPFLTVGIVGLSWAFFAGYVHKKSQHLRELAALQADKAGASYIAERLRDFSKDSEKTNETILFLDGDDRAAGLGSLALCFFVNGIVLVFVFVMVLMFSSGNIMAIILFFFLLPFEWIGIGIFLATIRKLTGPRSPDYVILAHPTEPVAEAMEIELHWLYLGKNRNISHYQELRLIVARDNSKNSFLWLNRNKQQQIIESATKDQNSIDITGKITGESTFHLTKSDQPSRFNTYQGSVDFIVQWKTLGVPQAIKSFTLGQTTSND